MVEVLVASAMLFSLSFALGLLAYLRQAALSLHRAPTAFCEAMRSYCEAHALPHPARVAAFIDLAAPSHESKVSKVMGSLFRSAVVFSDAELEELRVALQALETVLEKRVVESEAERIRIRLALSSAEELVRRKLGKHAGKVERIEHLNESPDLELKPLGDLVGARWPDSP